MIKCYCEFIKEYYPNSTLIAILKNKEEEIKKLIDNYLGYSYYV